MISDHDFGPFLMWEIGLRDWLTGSGRLRLEFEDTLEVALQIVLIVEKPWAGIRFTFRPRTFATHHIR
ncbi:MAG: hypothetical protein HY360_09235 [Verrucomicrobia bacterium]|nr:hypothetical protein [Verrucomicrobiota bacterium]